MANRLSLQTELETALGSRNVYYQPPESKKMEYDAIRYSMKNIISRHADDVKYHNKNCYEIIVIAKRPDPQVVDRLLAMPYCSFDRFYAADNLNHYVFTLYY